MLSSQRRAKCSPRRLARANVRPKLEERPTLSTKLRYEGHVDALTSSCKVLIGITAVRARQMPDCTAADRDKDQIRPDNAVALSETVTTRTKARARTQAKTGGTAGSVGAGVAGIFPRTCDRCTHFARPVGRNSMGTLGHNRMKAPKDIK
jgi:hypothetical protein